MPLVDFNRRFTWKPRANVMQDFGPGHAMVTQACAKAAVAAGAGVLVREEKPRRRGAENLGDWDGDGQPGGDAAAGRAEGDAPSAGKNPES